MASDRRQLRSGKPDGHRLRGLQAVEPDPSLSDEEPPSGGSSSLGPAIRFVCGNPHPQTRGSRISRGLAAGRLKALTKTMKGPKQMTLDRSTSRIRFTALVGALAAASVVALGGASGASAKVTSAGGLDYVTEKAGITPQQQTPLAARCPSGTSTAGGGAEATG